MAFMETLPRLEFSLLHQHLYKFSLLLSAKFSRQSRVNYCFSGLTLGD